jgi:hypothetical protein
LGYGDKGTPHGPCRPESSSAALGMTWEADRFCEPDTHLVVGAADAVQPGEVSFHAGLMSVTLAIAVLSPAGRQVGFVPEGDILRLQKGANPLLSVALEGVGGPPRLEEKYHSARTDRAPGAASPRHGGGAHGVDQRVDVTEVREHACGAGGVQTVGPCRGADADEA